ncbi:MAG: 50S ribosomal protein L32 [Candidatus Raymondbacteria bacterium RifOxyC12_full_50_8]|uniref:Large ribosomal subunit protein bL32 n=1 Tax=Candidatus Raymondbacteria bacterium RIFOXYD12_FULL_49_13 TaxID=1817890 RepID=A0A1F7FC96_UNCRA|nr:MAG: 50S ribosomal protein L32 [Candidatus Raymondbacteria bacterium RifOxyB12_full_50_8]OGJ89518.1 MAG: 50S ribosomal protein L32 [Candidatus Raymondbacteria bacterium RIFOXYA2_FULL_49_16]OGJ96807.1 MAG: 50S ribosomal protein L32 [Candidatus Raymondbacteria bacterium RifOxyC12_full_50_8]OGK04231.1 MAG: 50S ribosomal protein L32 [Candidatus Raymondbacteria bacterium RIFOXYD12_FULL_49_13]OGP42486.1 MAG: 50S ribosomal protein L32 [Candidatus Raymondbacteria bacterium RIFOXYB2_FULL_49_35]
MAVPKRRHSKSRRDKRRATWKLKSTPMAKCGHCQQPIVPHRICPHCGYYGGVEVLRVEEE